MIKLIKLIFCAILLFLSFLLGVRYSENTRNLSNWIFETKEKEINLDEIKEDIKIQSQGNDSNYIILDDSESIAEKPINTIEEKPINTPEENPEPKKEEVNIEPTI